MEADSEPPTTQVTANVHDASTVVGAPMQQLADDLHHDEIARTKSFAGGTAIIAGLGAVAQHINQSTSWVGPIARVLVPILALEAAALWYLAAVKKAYSRGGTIAFGATAVLCSAAIEADVGLFSPIIAASVLGIPFFARARTGPIVWAFAGLKIAIYVALATAVIFDVLPDDGHFSATHVPRSQKITQMLLVTGLFVLGLLHGRSSRKSALESIALARAGAIEARRRVAQLDEARGDLEAALRAQRGRDGIYTGTRVGAWEVGALIGRGAMGEVYAAQNGDGEEAALKLLTGIALEDETGRVRFVREASVASRLRSPNLVEVHAVGEGNDGVPYMAMELLSGEDLASILRREERLDVRAAADMVEDVSRGLAVAHASGIVHRDLKPANIFRVAGKRPVWKVLDFGVCTEEGSSGTLTADRIIGTPLYMAPEQAESQAVGRRTDLFALGAVVYRSLTGVPPFTGATAPQLLYAIVHDAPVRPSELVASLPTDVDAVLAIALAKKPEDRFTSATEMAAALRDAVSGRLDPALRARADAIASWRPFET
ncbi:MAG: serine/threonine protein kinase [Labilithrix sp.]|nr:serine/threonine protein kinase [Labilithrix sp.]MCW5815879.1 serine/threonine protein kinase [Labilithrix sp.]